MLLHINAISLVKRNTKKVIILINMILWLLLDSNLENHYILTEIFNYI